ncbi:MAG: GNAT family N-acetyltransferase [Gammaproteobacteria bacterium]|nr:GNAT family N-acetyltransferase [Gammaproteobacteria bacterium]
MNSLNRLLHDLSAAAAKAFHRYPLVFAGERDWCYAQADHTLKELSFEEVLWISRHESHIGSTYTAASAQHHLGMEFQAVVFDVYNGFDPDVFTAICGTIKGGGLLLMLCPPLADWQRFDDPQKARLAVWPYQRKDIGGRFLEYMARRLNQDDRVVLIEQSQPLPCLPQHILQSDQSPPVNQDATFPYRSKEQQQAVQAILHVVSGHRHRPLVITSDRGRGKSAALGIAAARLMRQGVKTIIVTAPRRAAVFPVFQCAQSLLPDARAVKGKLTCGDSTLRFVAPDELLQQRYACNLLLVDEAAAVPAALLEQYLKRYARIVFSTTVHGYEGTGRGFALRFHATLNQTTPGWQAVSLEAPIRWAQKDPLESFVFDALVLDASPAADEVASQADLASCHCEKLDRDGLLNHTDDLRQLFALLVLAHYQTQPADLRYLLDARDVHIYVVRHGQHIVAAALLEEEGGFDPDLAAKVYANERRVRGHLLAQSLAAYVGLSQAPQLKYLRVMRIAVHPLAQQKGLGRFLLRHIEKTLLPEEFDLWGASFGATPALLQFWWGSGFEPVHLGMSRNAASGMHAALVLKPLSDRGEAVLQGAQLKFTEHFPVMLAESYRDLEPALVQQLLNQQSSAVSDAPFALSERDWQDVKSFVSSARDYEVNAVPLWTLTRLGLANTACAAGLTSMELTLLVAKVLQKKSWNEIVRETGLRGRKQALAELRLAAARLYQYCAGV